MGRPQRLVFKTLAATHRVGAGRGAGSETRPTRSSALSFRRRMSKVQRWNRVLARTSTRRAASKADAGDPRKMRGRLRADPHRPASQGPAGSPASRRCCVVGGQAIRHRQDLPAARSRTRRSERFRHRPDGPLSLRCVAQTCAPQFPAEPLQRSHRTRQSCRRTERTRHEARGAGREWRRGRDVVSREGNPLGPGPPRQLSCAIINARRRSRCTARPSLDLIGRAPRDPDGSRAAFALFGDSTASLCQTRRVVRASRDRRGSPPR